MEDLHITRGRGCEDIKEENMEQAHVHQVGCRAGGQMARFRRGVCIALEEDVVDDGGKMAGNEEHSNRVAISDFLVRHDFGEDDVNLDRIDRLPFFTRMYW